MPIALVLSPAAAIPGKADGHRNEAASVPGSKSAREPWHLIIAADGPACPFAPSSTGKLALAQGPAARPSTSGRTRRRPRRPLGKRTVKKALARTIQNRGRDPLQQRGRGRCRPPSGGGDGRDNDCGRRWTWQAGATSETASRAPGSVKFRAGGDSPRPDRSQRPVDQVEILDRR